MRMQRRRTTTKNVHKELLNVDTALFFCFVAVDDVTTNASFRFSFGDFVVFLVSILLFFTIELRQSVAIEHSERVASDEQSALDFLRVIYCHF